MNLFLLLFIVSIVPLFLHYRHRHCLHVLVRSVNIHAESASVSTLVAAAVPILVGLTQKVRYIIIVVVIRLHLFLFVFVAGRCCCSSLFSAFYFFTNIQRHEYLFLLHLLLQSHFTCYCCM